MAFLKKLLSDMEVLFLPTVITVQVRQVGTRYFSASQLMVAGMGTVVMADQVEAEMIVTKEVDPVYLGRVTTGAPTMEVEGVLGNLGRMAITVRGATVLSHASLHPAYQTPELVPISQVGAEGTTQVAELVARVVVVVSAL